MVKKLYVFCYEFCYVLRGRGYLKVQRTVEGVLEFFFTLDKQGPKNCF